MQTCSILACDKDWKFYIPTVEPSSIAIPDHLRVFQKHYLTICTTIEYPEILSQQLLHEELVTEDDISQVRKATKYC